MTPEEKAKAYDEALERAKGDYIAYRKVGDIAGIDSIVSIFPEPAESEDERIRTALLRCCDDWEKGQFGCMAKEDVPAIRAYLEKQKESLHDSEICKENADSFTDEGERIRKEIINYINFAESHNLLRAADYEKKKGWIAYLEKQKEQKPKMTPKWLYRLEFKDSSCGLWYDGAGKWCFESGIGSIGGCKTKTLPMVYDVRYKQDGRDWFSSCSRKEDLMHWYSLEDAKELISKGFVFTRYLATEYHEYDQQTVFIKETALYREEIDIFELFEQQKPTEWSEEEAKKAAEDYADEFPGMTHENDGSTIEDYDKPYNDFLAGVLWAKHHGISQNGNTHWKPREEQMIALEGCLEHWNGNKCQKEILESLYEQLKKLA